MEQSTGRDIRKQSRFDVQQQLHNSIVLCTQLTATTQEKCQHPAQVYDVDLKSVADSELMV
jgi:hypothetical protein